MSSVPQPLTYRRLWISLGVANVLAVIVASLVPGGTLGGGFASHDKLSHAGAYLVLMVWFAGLQPRRTWRWVALALLGMGLVLEIAQGMMHMDRMADPGDVIANAAGIGIGAMVAARGLASWPYRLETWLARR
ncbi:MAG TPA: hypothetical protein VL546_07490 [Steroidobacteraceae bacterium]|nr:hypothetical protein [Steroidobacteraceae bacterium]